MLSSIEVSITTDAGGDAVDYAGVTISGRVVGIKYEYGTLAATSDFVIIGETSLSPILTISDVAQANTFWTPRVLGNKHTDGSAFTDSGVRPTVYGERIKITTAQGGNAATGTMTFYIEDDNFKGG